MGWIILILLLLPIWGTAEAATTGECIGVMNESIEHELKDGGTQADSAKAWDAVKKLVKAGQEATVDDPETFEVFQSWLQIASHEIAMLQIRSMQRGGAIGLAVATDLDGCR